LKELLFLKGKFWLLASLAVFLPIKELMLTIGFLVAADMVVGIWKALKLKQRIRSRRMSDTITKLLLYQIAIMSGFLIESFIISELIPITKLVATVIAVIEFKSIIESIESVTGKDLWSRIKTIIGRKSEDITDAMTDGKDK
jgi:predicted neutral ceramidase superfamily lipid hydrolase